MRRGADRVTFPSAAEWKLKLKEKCVKSALGSCVWVMLRMRAATRRWKIPQVFTDIYLPEWSLCSGPFSRCGTQRGTTMDCPQVRVACCTYHSLGLSWDYVGLRLCIFENWWVIKETEMRERQNQTVSDYLENMKQKWYTADMNEDTFRVS